jgi:hypothetical protein
LENQVDNKYIMEIKIYDSERLPWCIKKDN